MAMCRSLIMSNVTALDSALDSVLAGLHRLNTLRLWPNQTRK